MGPSSQSLLVGSGSETHMQKAARVAGSLQHERSILLLLHTFVGQMLAMFAF